jgi:hypothetical protein
VHFLTHFSSQKQKANETERSASASEWRETPPDHQANETERRIVSIWQNASQPVVRSVSLSEDSEGVGCDPDPIQHPSSAKHLALYGGTCFHMGPNEEDHETNNVWHCAAEINKIVRHVKL